ncbi:methyltransferase [Streptomyces sp. NPDC005876]|uniref:methyltransferase n=1 Tax=Streptomyces sp. NPDC005876 TaxID=3157076 RepID=UPI0033D2B159
MDELSPIPIFEMTAGLWISKTLAITLEFDLYTILDDQPGLTFSQVAQILDLEQRPVELLMTACAACGLLQRHGDGYTTTPLSSRYLVRGKPDYFGAWVEMIDKHDYPGWEHFGEAVRGNHPTAFDPTRQASLFDERDPVVVQVFWEAMHAMSVSTARALGTAVDLSGNRRLLDVGGGGATYDIELCRRYPDLVATVYDQPFVCDLTRPKVQEADLENRISLQDGDFFAEPLPAGYDTILLSNTLHDWDEPDCRRILAKCFEALPQSGLLLICELLVNDEKTGPPQAALMSLAMLVETWGRNYTAAEFTSWLLDTGFTDIQVVPFTAPGANSAILARKPR